VSLPRNVHAVADARDGHCTACHVRLRPQMYNDVRKGERLVQCESCNRILYIVPPKPAPETQQTTASA
jgi:predicted  nucleic acid-binding Zn-ribbon protein